jgi:hypothetical protein
MLLYIHAVSTRTHPSVEPPQCVHCFPVLPARVACRLCQRRPMKRTLAWAGAHAATTEPGCDDGPLLARLRLNDTGTVLPVKGQAATPTSSGGGSSSSSSAAPAGVVVQLGRDHVRTAAAAGAGFVAIPEPPGTSKRLSRVHSELTFRPTGVTLAHASRATGTGTLLWHAGKATLLVAGSPPAPIAFGEEFFLTSTWVPPVAVRVTLLRPLGGKGDGSGADSSSSGKGSSAGAGGDPPSPVGAGADAGPAGGDTSSSGQSDALSGTGGNHSGDTSTSAAGPGGGALTSSSSAVDAVRARHRASTGAAVAASSPAAAGSTSCSGSSSAAAAPAAAAGERRSSRASSTSATAAPARAPAPAPAAAAAGPRLPASGYHGVKEHVGTDGTRTYEVRRAAAVGRGWVAVPPCSVCRGATAHSTPSPPRVQEHFARRLPSSLPSLPPCAGVHPPRRQDAQPGPPVRHRRRGGGGARPRAAGTVGVGAASLVCALQLPGPATGAGGSGTDCSAAAAAAAAAAVRSQLRLR